MRKSKQAELDRLMFETLRRAGVYRLRAEGRKPCRADFPDLSVDQRTPPCGNGFGPTRGKRELPADAKQFPVGHLHKQGLQVITCKDDLPWFGGKKS